MKAEIGSVYRHFKGHIIEVLNIGRDVDTLEEMVVYKHLKTNEVWIRSRKEFESEVDHIKYPDVSQKYRFELIEKAL